MSDPILVAQGDAFTWPAVHSDGDLTGYSIRAQIRKGGVLVDEFAVVLDPDQTANPGAFTMAITAEQTLGWPTGELKWDIESTPPSGEPKHTPVRRFFVREAQTRPAE